MTINLQISEKVRRLPITRAMWVMIGLISAGVISAMVRYIFGIGAISDLSNAYPWGFWISFDLYCGVALGAGAFTIVAIVEIFDLKEYRPLLRPSILTGLLGYILVVIALLVDLGQPLRIWHMIIYQNHTSILFEVGICVMLYTTVLLIEFSPVVFEGFKKHQIANHIHQLIFPFVILGVVLSTLHQSSLGSLLIIERYKLHPLWWSPFLPVLFFFSALSGGLGMIILESSLSARGLGKGLETQLLEKLAKGSVFTLLFYLVLKFGELAYAGELALLITSGFMSILFWAEIIIGVILPTVLFSLRSVRQTPNGQLFGAVFIILGLILNRFNASWFAIKHANPLTYVPAFMGNVKYAPTIPEIAVSIGIVSAGVLAFNLVSKYLPVFEHGENEAPAQSGD
jgi:Ni/Fe-hydrogenase subunit HybB-like protein